MNGVTPISLQKTESRGSEIDATGVDAIEKLKKLRESLGHEVIQAVFNEVASIVEGQNRNALDNFIEGFKPKKHNGKVTRSEKEKIVFDVFINNENLTKIFDRYAILDQWEKRIKQEMNVIGSFHIITDGRLEPHRNEGKHLLDRISEFKKAHIDALSEETLPSIEAKFKQAPRSVAMVVDDSKPEPTKD